MPATPSAKSPPWSQAVRDRDSPERDAFLDSHIELVKYVALRISSRLPASVEVEDLINDGVIGLLDATEKFNPDRGVRFRTYAESRIRGAILDGLRQKDWRPRSIRLMQRQLDKALLELSTIHRRPATEEELAEALSLSVSDYRSMLADLNTGPLLSLDELPHDLSKGLADEGLPDQPLEHQDLLRVLSEEIENLPPRERHVLELYYHEGLNMKEVGRVLGITESRVCQLHAQAAGRLRVALRQRLHYEARKRVPSTAGRS